MTHINDGHGLALCKNTDGSLVTGGLHSDCPACRELQMLCPVQEKGSEPRPESEWTPEPMPGAETMVEDVRRERNAETGSNGHTK